MRRLLVATNNKGKLGEILSLLEDLRLDLVTPQMLGIDMDVEEHGSTYDENASLKAVALVQASGVITLADDSGLEVDVLGGLPGIRSARFSPLPNATDADRRVQLLSNLHAHPRPWMAHFHCSVAIATPQGDVFFSQGDCPGEIIPDERGSNGFGYDPIFFIPEAGLTMAELEMPDKNRLSHRARAIKAALPTLLELLQGQAGGTV